MSCTSIMDQFFTRLPPNNLDANQYPRQLKKRVALVCNISEFDSGITGSLILNHS